MHRALLVCLCWLVGLVPGHAQDTVALHCARGNVQDYPDARLTLNGEGPRFVHVTFVGYRPSAVRAEWSLRDCLRTAIRYDDSRDIVATLWYREPRLRSPREPLELYDDSRKLMYRASTGRIVLR
jgi:hypothetical protein